MQNRELIVVIRVHFVAAAKILPLSFQLIHPAD